jgi:serine/threonine protein kinase
MVRRNSWSGVGTTNLQRILQQIYKGIHGVVWEEVLTPKRNCKQVAIKFLHRKHLEDLESTDPSQRAQAKHFSLAFTNEIQLLEALCGHPNIIEIKARAKDNRY